MRHCSEMAVSETAVSQLTLQNTQSLTNLSLSVNEILVGHYSTIRKRSIHTSLFNVKLYYLESSLYVANPLTVNKYFWRGWRGESG